MSYRIDDSIISNFLTNHTNPVQLASLQPDPSSQFCPICREPYHSQDPAYLHPLLLTDTFEYPVQVVDRGPCRHIFGRRCIERQLRAGQPWSHVCPICRQEWLPTPHPARGEIIGTLDNVLGVLEQLEMRNEAVRREVHNVEQALEGIRELLYGQRWI